MDNIRPRTAGHGPCASHAVVRGGAARGGTIRDSITQDEYCDVDEPTAACVARAGAADFILLGKVPAQGACPEEGVAQLINDHTALKMSGACVEIDQ